MAGPNVGTAYVNVEAKTDKVAEQIKRGFGSVNSSGRRAGESLGQAFSRGFNKYADKSTMTRWAEGLRTAVPGAEKARAAWAALTRASFFLQTAISQLIGGLFSLVGGLGAIAGSAGGAAAALVVVANGGFALVAGMIAARLALSGVGKALGALNKQSAGAASNAKAVEAAERALAGVIESNRENLIQANNDVRDAQLELNEAFKEGREEIQQIGFEAENAALSEKKAALELEKARETLARVQDLPPNSRARKEAELAFQEAELNLRMAKDRNADLTKEQKRLAKTGVAGTKAVITAANNLAKAEENKSKTIRDGLRAQADAERNLADAKNSSAGAGGGGEDPLAGLNQYQKDFVAFLQTLKPLYEELKLAASKAFLPPLQEAIQLLADKAFPTIKKGISQVAGAMGNAAISIAEAITETENLADLQTVFAGSATIIEKLGSVVGHIWDIAMSVMAAATPLAERFVSFLDSKMGKFAEFLDTEQAAGRLQKFFDRAGEIFGDISEIFGNIFGGFGKIIKANFDAGSPGDRMLQWLKESTDKFANLDKMAGGSKNLTDYFDGAATNMQSVMQSIGALLTEFIKVADNPAIARTFDILKAGAPAIGRILEKSIEAGPQLATLVQEIVKIIDTFTDTKSIQTFFDTLTTAAKAVNALLSNPFAKSIIDAIANVAAFGLAIGTIGKIAKFSFEAVTGSVATVADGFGQMADWAEKASGAIGGKGGKAGKSIAGALDGVATFLKGPWGVALTVAVVAGMAFVDWMNEGVASAEEYNKVLDGTHTAVEMLTIGMKGAEQQTVFMGGDARAALYDFNGALRVATPQVTALKDGMQTLSSETNNAFIGLGPKLSAGAQAIKNVATNIDTLAKTNMPSAQLAFAELMTKTDGSVEAFERMLALTPGMKKSLEEQAKATGLITDETTEAEKKQILYNAAIGEGALGADAQKLALDRAADSIRNYADTALGAIDSEIKYEQSVDDVTTRIQEQKDAYIEANGSLDGFNLSTDRGTQAGRDNMTALNDLARSVNDHAASVLEDTGSQEKATEAINKGRDSLMEQAKQFFDTEEEAKAYVDSVLATPESIKTTANLETTDAEGKKSKLAAPGTSEITAYITPKKASGWDTFWGNFWSVFNARGAGSANGNMFAYANGGFAGPGVYKGRPGSLYKFAEPETRWEAFISGKAGQEQRNIEIWKEAGRRLGVLAETNADGGMYGLMKTAQSASALAQSGANNAADLNQTINKIEINVQPSPGMDERELAAAVSRELAFQMRRGAVA